MEGHADKSVYCPNCQSELAQKHRTVDNAAGNRGVMYLYATYCPSCGWTGPWCFSRKEAEKSFLDPFKEILILKQRVLELEQVDPLSERSRLSKIVSENVLMSSLIPNLKSQVKDLEAELAKYKHKEFKSTP